MTCVVILEPVLEKRNLQCIINTRNSYMKDRHRTDNTVFNNYLESVMSIYLPLELKLLNTNYRAPTMQLKKIYIYRYTLNKEEQ